MDESINEVWKSRDIPRAQYEIVKKELEDLRQGKPHAVWQTATDFLKTIEGDDLTLLDVGCASGYFYEIFNTLLPGKFIYTGGDYSEAMLRLAERNYPDATFCGVDVRNIQFENQSFDVVFSSACLEHIKDDWKVGLQEMCRVAKKYVVLHKTPLIITPTKFTERKIYGDNTVVFNKFNQDEFFGIVYDCGFKHIYDTKTHNRASEYRLVVFQRLGE